jgi:16S rRNA (cytidine1402-2'-O)-methyltransferase
MGAIQGKLYLIPTVIAEGTQHKVISVHVKNELKNIQHFLAENVRTARRFFSSLKVFDSIEMLQFDVFDKDTKEEDLPVLFAPVYAGHNLGIVSESGCPGIADPGSSAVKYAHQNNIVVVPLVGPSSVVLALMGSGLNGQHFVFNGYLPVDAKQSAKVIRELEKESIRTGRTQIFIETPYRNTELLKRLIATLKPDTNLCVATDLTGDAESIRMLPIRYWRTKSPELPRLPTIFLFQTSSSTLQ